MPNRVPATERGPAGVVDRDPDEGVIIALAVVADLAQVEPALLRQEGRVDHVHGVRIDPHQPGEHRAGDRLLVQFGRRALDLDRDAGDPVALDLADQAAELLGQLHIGPELRRLLGGERGHVERVGDAAADQEVGHLLGDLDRDIDLRLGGRGAEMRRRDEAGRAEQGVVLRRLLDEHVERGAADMAALQRVLQRRLVDQPAAGAIDDADAALGPGQILGGEDVAGLRRSAACAG